MAQAADIGIDLGTTNIVVYVRGKGIVIREPALIAYDRDSERVRAIGEDARQMLGRTPGNLSAVRPLKTGSITDYVLTEQLLRYFIQKAMGRRGFIKPRIASSVPSRLTDVERRAVEEASYQAGAREVVIVPEPIAAAIGAGLDVTRPVGNMIVDIGGGVTNIAVISLNGIVQAVTIPIGGDAFTEQIIRYVRKRHMLFIGEQTAEAVKLRIGNASTSGAEQTAVIRGRNVVTGLPNEVTLTSTELVEPMMDLGEKIAESVCTVIRQTLPELAGDISRRGIVLCGGGAGLRGVDEIITKRSGIVTLTADNPASVVAVGTGRYPEVMAQL